MLVNSPKLKAPSLPELVHDVSETLDDSVILVLKVLGQVLLEVLTQPVHVIRP